MGVTTRTRMASSTTPSSSPLSRPRPHHRMLLRHSSLPSLPSQLSVQCQNSSYGIILHYNSTMLNSSSKTDKLFLLLMVQMHEKHKLDQIQQVYSLTQTTNQLLSIQKNLKDMKHFW